MACPIFKFIYFAANNSKCGASNENNPNRHQAMSGQFKEEYWKAAWKETETLELMDIFPDSKVKKFKSRFCARGDQNSKVWTFLRRMHL
ncbi:hypothetical protein ACHAW6_005682 [Cyclotella cf. meneghiniana]